MFKVAWNLPVEERVTTWEKVSWTSVYIFQFSKHGMSTWKL